MSAGSDCGPNHCVTCSDEGIPMLVLAASGDGLALCADGDGSETTVMTALVGSVAPGDGVLVHAGAALARLDGELDV